MTIQDIARQFTSLTVDRSAAFDDVAAAVYAYQAAHNPVYGRYCKEHTYLPVEAFKHAPVTTFPPDEAAHVFESSRTGRSVPSRHYVRDLSVYERAVTAHFEHVFGAGPFTLVAHLPHYEARGDRSSLVYMVRHLMERYGGAHSAFFLQDRRPLLEAAAYSAEHETPFILFGAAFGLLNLVEEQSVSLPPGAVVVETGGMKTFRRELSRADLHARLADGFGLTVDRIWSEYGMCELMSQCYTRGGPVFFPPPWMRFHVLDPENPSAERGDGEPGALALVDLANLYSASFLLTEDRAVRRGEGFEVLGRLSGAELRGCNFLVETALADEE